MPQPAITVWDELVQLIEDQKLNRELVIAGKRGSGTALAALRRAANEVRYKTLHFRAITVPSLTEEQIQAAHAEHLRRWSQRKIPGRVKRGP